MLQQGEERDRLVRKQETLERLGISESTYFRLIRARVLPAVLVGQSFRVRERDIRYAIEHGLPREKAPVDMAPALHPQWSTEGA